MLANAIKFVEKIGRHTHTHTQMRLARLPDPPPRGTIGLATAATKGVSRSPIDPGRHGICITGIHNIFCKPTPIPPNTAVY